MTSATAARSRRRARLRATAFPTFRLAVKPTRRPTRSPGPVLSRSAFGWFRSSFAFAAWRIRPGAAHLRRAAATRRKSGRRFSRPTAAMGRLDAEALATFGTPPGQDPLAADGCHARPKAMTTLADEHAVLKRALHDGLR